MVQYEFADTTKGTAKSVAATPWSRWLEIREVNASFFIVFFEKGETTMQLKSMINLQH